MTPYLDPTCDRQCGTWSFDSRNRAQHKRRTRIAIQQAQKPSADKLEVSHECVCPKAMQETSRRCHCRRAERERNQCPRCYAVELRYPLHRTIAAVLSLAVCAIHSGRHRLPVAVCLDALPSGFLLL